MPSPIFTLIFNLKEENERLKKEKKLLTTTVFDHRLTIRELKKALEEQQKKAA